MFYCQWRFRWRYSLAFCLVKVVHMLEQLIAFYCCTFACGRFFLTFCVVQRCPKNRKWGNILLTETQIEIKLDMGSKLFPFHPLLKKNKFWVDTLVHSGLYWDLLQTPNQPLLNFPLDPRSPPDQFYLSHFPVPRSAPLQTSYQPPDNIFKHFQTSDQCGISEHTKVIWDFGHMSRNRKWGLVFPTLLYRISQIPALGDRTSISKPESEHVVGPWDPWDPGSNLSGVPKNQDD